METTFSLEPYRHDLEVIRDTVSQIKKDFSQFDLEINFSGDEQTAYPELKSQLIILFKDLLHHNSEKIFALLYRIDVSEQELKQITASISFEEHVTELVLERELRKVVMRKLYSK